MMKAPAISREQILKEIKRVAAQNGGQSPGVNFFSKEAQISPSAWQGIHWVRWSDALIEAGLAPNDWQKKTPSEEVFEAFIAICRHYQHIPSSAEIDLFRRTNATFPTRRALFSHFGSKLALVDNLRKWISDKDEYADILDIIGDDHGESSSVGSTSEGHVYLIQSGAHYKIGRSDELERRIKEIRIALPEAASLIHTIRTDDPAGIEAYWHRRFAEKRVNGEWFKLSKLDIATFKRRKFQ